MELFRMAHVVTCWVFLAALVLQFGAAGSDAAGGELGAHVLLGGTLLHALLPLVLMASAWLGGLGSRQVLLGAVPLALLAAPGMHPALALLSAGHVCFWVLGPALDAAPADTVPATDRLQFVPMS